MTNPTAEQPSVEHRHRFRRDIAALAGSAAAGQFLIVAVSPALTRLFSPEDFGTFAVYSSITSLFALLATWRYELAIPLPADDAEAAEISTVALALLLLGGTGTALGVFFAGDYLLAALNATQLGSIRYAVSLGVLTGGCVQISQAWIVRRRRFSLGARATIAQAVAQTGLQLFFGVIGGGPLGLIFGQLAGQLVSAAIASIPPKRGEWLWNVSGIRKLRAVAARYRHYATIYTPSALLNSASIQSSALLLAVYYDAQIVGWFALGQRLVGVPMSLLGQAVARVYFGEASRMQAMNAAGMSRLFNRTAGRLLATGIVPIGSIAVFGPKLAILMFGADWMEAGLYSRYLAPMYLAQLVVSPLSQSANVLGRHTLQIASDGSRFVIIVGGFWLLGSSGFNARDAVQFYSIAMTLHYAVLFAALSVVVRRNERLLTRIS